jgi:CelD/BcsL family acetyltransferase involved in cellulose biosynthesis
MMAMRTATVLRGSPTSRSEVLTEWRGFTDLARPWNELNHVSASGPFVSHRWLAAWFEAFGDGIEPRIAQVWRDGLLIAAAPLGLSLRPLSTKAHFVKVQTLHMLSNHRTGYNEWLVAPGHEDAIPLLLEIVMRETGAWRVAELEPFRRSPRLDALVAAAQERGVRCSCDTTIQSAIVDLSEGWDRYLAARSRDFRKNIRVSRKRVEATQHRLERVGNGDAGILDRVLALSTRSWKGSAGTALGASKATRQFMRQLWSSLSPVGAMELWLLEIDGREAGSVTSIVDGDTIHGFAKDFDEEFSRLSPGRFLVSRWLEDGATRGFKRADMLRRTPFLQEFSDASYDMARVRLFPERSSVYLWLELEKQLRSVAREWRSRRRYQRKRRAAHKPTDNQERDLG